MFGTRTRWSHDSERVQQSTRGSFRALSSPSFQTPLPQYANNSNRFLDFYASWGVGLWLFPLIIIVFRLTHPVTCTSGLSTCIVGCYSIVWRYCGCFLSTQLLVDIWLLPVLGYYQ